MGENQKIASGIGCLKTADKNFVCELSYFFKLMGDSTRIRLLMALGSGETCVGELADMLRMTKSAVSHQLKLLRSAKLVKTKKCGKNVFYSLSDNHVRTVLETAIEHISEQGGKE